jgi:hypothetical protein
MNGQRTEKDGRVMKIVREDGERRAREGAGTDWGRAGGGRAWCSGVCCDSMVFGTRWRSRVRSFGGGTVWFDPSRTFRAG